MQIVSAAQTLVLSKCGWYHSGRALYAGSTGILASFRFQSRPWCAQMFLTLSSVSSHDPKIALDTPPTWVATRSRTSSVQPWYMLVTFPSDISSTVIQIGR